MSPFGITMLSVGGLLLIAIVICALRKKDYLSYSKIFTPVLKSLYSILVAIGNLNPNSALLSTIVTIVKGSIDAAGYAEALWLKNVISKEDRPEQAKQYITIILNEAGIEVTEVINTIIQGAIALTCYLLPHYSDSEEKEGN